MKFIGLPSRIENRIRGLSFPPSFIHQVIIITGLNREREGRERGERERGGGGRERGEREREREGGLTPCRPQMPTGRKTPTQTQIN